MNNVVQYRPDFDVLRSLAALAVVVGHLRALFVVEYTRSAIVTPAVKAAYFLTGLGHESVIVFFVLSGYLISGVVLKQKRSWSWRAYLVARLTRLWVVLVPALVACAVCDSIGARLTPELYNSPIPHLGAHAAGSGLTVVAFIGNAVFLQGFVVPCFGSNGPLWSLAYELWYYLLFPLLLRVPLEKSAIRKCCCGAIAILIVLLIGRVAALYFLIWLVGAASQLIPASITGGRLRYLALGSGVIATVSALSLSRLHVVTGFAADSLIAASVGFLIYTGKDGMWRFLGASSQIFRSVSAYSYTLYATHLPLLILVKAVFTSRHVAAFSLNGRTIWVCGALTAATMTYAWIMAHLFEARTDTVRRWVSNLLTQRNMSASVLPGMPARDGC